MSKTARILFTLIVGSLLSVFLVGAYAQQQQLHDGAVPPTGQNQQYILITTVAGFLSLLATNIFAIYRDSQRRKWDLEDRANARAEMRREALAQRTEIVETAVALAKVSEKNKDRLLGAIHDNTRLTEEAKSKAEQAYDVGNNFNTKIAELHEVLQAMVKREDQKSS